MRLCDAKWWHVISVPMIRHIIEDGKIVEIEIIPTPRRFVSEYEKRGYHQGWGS
jgi:hypothetical protein